MHASVLRLASYSPSATLEVIVTLTATSCGWPPIPHRLHLPPPPVVRRGVAAGPQFPIGYTIRLESSATDMVAAGPQFPIGYTLSPCRALGIRLRLALNSPSATLPQRRPVLMHRLRLALNSPSATLRVVTARPMTEVAAGPQFPIGYTRLWLALSCGRVAAGPQFPIGYTSSSRITS